MTIRKPTGARQSRVREYLLRTVSAAALSIALMQTPIAKADGHKSPTQMIIELYGGFPAGDKQVWAEVFPVPATPSIQPNFIGGAVFGFITPADRLWSHAGPEWNVGVFARFGLTDQNSKSGLATFYFNVLGGGFPTFYTSGSVSHSERHAMVDFEARRDVGLGSGSTPVTVKAGLRFGYFSADTNTRFVYLPIPAYTLAERRQSMFVGAGPRIGAEVSVPISDSVSLDLAAGASLLFGRKQMKVAATGALFGLTATTTRRSFAVVPMLEGQAALSFDLPNTSARISAGAKVDAWFGVHDTRNTVSITGGSFGKKRANRFWVSPFVRVTVPLGGQ